MNLSARHSLEHSRRPVLDVHFALDGPVIHQLKEAFELDWHFCTGERLKGPQWKAAEPSPAGDRWARVVRDGPEAEEERLVWHMLALIHAASESIEILTPYFIPIPSIESALITAAHRGVKVTLVIPEETDNRLVGWATMAMLEELIRANCEVRLAPSPFDHTKICVVDRAVASIGSANWDTRSFRLNYELNVEITSTSGIHSIVDEKIQRAKLYRITDWESRPLWIQLRDGFSRLFAPIL